MKQDEETLVSHNIPIRGEFAQTKQSETKNGPELTKNWMAMAINMARMERKKTSGSAAVQDNLNTMW